MNFADLNPILAADLRKIAESSLDFESLRNSKILVTGATGLVGSMLVKALLFCNQKLDLKLTTYALVRSKEKANTIFADFLPEKSFHYVVADLVKDEIIVEQHIDYIIHAASVTNSKMMVKKPVETIYTVIHGTEKILQLAAEKAVKSFVYISSMEMYGTFDECTELITEEKLGFVNPLKIRSNYPESKRMCENLCEAYLSEYGVPVKIARLAQTFGAGILPTENRVFAQFARSVLEGNDIVLHTTGQSEGNYSYLAETIEAVLLLLLKGKNGEAYNISNEVCHTTIANMAKMVAEEIADGKIKVVYDIPESNVFGYADDTYMKLSSEKIRNLGWKPSIDLREAYRRMIVYMETMR